MKFEFITEHQNDHTVSKMCKVLGVSRSGYYAYLERKNSGKITKREEFNQELDQLILEYYTASLGAYGSPKIHHLIVKNDKKVVSQKKVGNRMRALGLVSQAVKLYMNTTDSKHQYNVYENVLNREFNVKKPNSVWATDITYVHTAEGFVYVNPVIDLFNRKVISYCIDDTLHRSLSIRAIEHAIKIRQPEEGWIHHSDRGSQYASNDYIKVLKEAKAEISMSRKGNPYDNACVESFFASMKKEYLNHFAFQTKAEAIGAIEFYIEFYNRRRIHSTLDYVTPDEYEQAYYKAQKKYANQQEKLSV